MGGHEYLRDNIGMLVSAESLDRTKAFLEEIVQVCQRHKLTLSHEDTGGAFMVDAFRQDNLDWLLDAGVTVRVVDPNYTAAESKPPAELNQQAKEYIDRITGDSPE